VPNQKLQPRHAQTLKLLKRKRGVSAVELAENFTILVPTARAVISLTAKAAGVTVERDKETGRYRVL
jgi:hypothetical protein